MTEEEIQHEKHLTTILLLKYGSYTDAVVAFMTQLHIHTNEESKLLQKWLDIFKEQMYKDEKLEIPN